MHISLHLPTSPYISLHLPTSRYISLHLGLRDPHVDEAAHLLALVEHALLRAAAVDDEDGVVDGDRGLGDVGREHHLGEI